MKKDDYGLNIDDQLKARKNLLDWVKENECNIILAKLFEDYLYKSYKDINLMDDNIVQEKIFDNIEIGVDMSYFSIGGRVFPHTPRNTSELNEVIDFIVKDIWSKIETYDDLYQFVMCEIEGASMSENVNAQALVKFSRFNFEEYHNSLSGSPLMDKDDSASIFFMNVFTSLMSHYGMEEAIKIRCLCMMRFIDKYREEIDKARGVL